MENDWKSVTLVDSSYLWANNKNKTLPQNIYEIILLK